MRRFLSDAAFTGTSQLVSAFVALGVQIYVARSVSVLDYGQYASIQAFVLIIEAVFIARGGEVALQYIGHRWKKDMPGAVWFRDRLCVLDAKFNTLLYLVVVLMAYVLSPFLNFNWMWLAFLALTIPAQIGYGVYKSVFIIDGRFRQLALIEIVYSVLLLVLVLLLVHWIGILGVVLALPIGAVLKTLLVMTYSRRLWPVDVLPVLPEDSTGVIGLRAFWTANLHSVARNSLMNGASQGDILILNAMQGPDVAALYKVAKTTAAIPIRIVVPIWVVMRSRIMGAMRRRDFPTIRNILAVLASLLVVVGLVGAVPLTHLTEPLIALAFGDKYVMAGSAALWLLLGSWIFGAVSGWLNFACVITSKKSVGSFIYFVWAVIVLVGGVLWGKEGATQMAIVSTLGMVLASGFGWLFYMRREAWIGT